MKPTYPAVIIGIWSLVAGCTQRAPHDDTDSTDPAPPTENNTADTGSVAVDTAAATADTHPGSSDGGPIDGDTALVRPPTTDTGQWEDADTPTDPSQTATGAEPPTDTPCTAACTPDDGTGDNAAPHPDTEEDTAADGHGSEDTGVDPATTDAADTAPIADTDADTQSDAEPPDTEEETTDTASEARDTAPDTDVPDADSGRADTDTADAETTDTLLDTASTDTESAESGGTDTDTAALLLWEVDYDMPGVDTAEFIEVYNPTADCVPLDGWVLVLVDGNKAAEYARYPLAAESVCLESGAVWWIGAQDMAAPVPPWQTWGANAVQNGPDALVLGFGDPLTPVDALCYEGPLSAFTDAQGALVPLPPCTPPPADAGLADALHRDLAADGWTLAPPSPGIP